MNWLQKLSDLSAPPGISLQSAVQAVAEEIANTIIHEAAHGKDWAVNYLNKKNFQEQDRTGAEAIADQAVDTFGYGKNRNIDMFDDSTQYETMGNYQILQKAIQLANAKNPFYIPPETVVEASLSSNVAGQWNMSQQPRTQLYQTSNPAIAWNENNKQIEVNVSQIVNLENIRLQNAFNARRQSRPPTYQEDGMFKDTVGISKQPPTGQSSVFPTVPGRNSVPSW